MRKIPTLYQRDPDDRRHVTRQVTPGCEWVLAGEGRATRKYDGTCVMFDGATWWARREVKPGKAEPHGFRAEQHDEATGKTQGWEPAEQSPFWKQLAEALDAGLVGYVSVPQSVEPVPPPGTYELVGPKINGNPEGGDHHVLVMHGYEAYMDHVALASAPRNFDGLRDWLLAHPYEGVVWHHGDGRMAKLKRRDFS